ncbi:tetratricopeptide repeat protein [uncultured Lamprocystis sp.]|uniref:tetratricopeptide repeat protein n=1 Tax=uncultured Lamprocystis sp. TaxID=543132 RepID=UPI00341655AC
MRRACERAPDKAHHWNSLGNLLTKHLGRYDEAESAYRKSAELDPKFAYPGTT